MRLDVIVPVFTKELDPESQARKSHIPHSVQSAPSCTQDSAFDRGRCVVSGPSGHWLENRLSLKPQKIVTSPAVGKLNVPTEERAEVTDVRL